MPSISVLYDHNIEGTEELQDKILEFVDEVIVGEFGAELLASDFPDLTATANRLPYGDHVIPGFSICNSSN